MFFTGEPPLIASDDEIDYCSENIGLDDNVFSKDVNPACINIILYDEDGNIIEDVEEEIEEVIEGYEIILQSDPKTGIDIAFWMLNINANNTYPIEY
jgi:hypothetical protein